MVLQEGLDVISLEGRETVRSNSVMRVCLVLNYAHGKMLENPPPEKMTCSQAPSGSLTVDPGFTWVAPTAVTKGQEACGYIL
jgi:hypothetical protein